MNNLRKKIAILAISLVSFLGFQSVSNAAPEGFSLGLAINESGFMGSGKETMTGSGASTSQKDITEEDGAFKDSVASVFAEYSVNDTISVKKGIDIIKNSNQLKPNKHLAKKIINFFKIFFYFMKFDY